jgi:methyl-accepting chemotaxis protein
MDGVVVASQHIRNVIDEMIEVAKANNVSGERGSQAVADVKDSMNDVKDTVIAAMDSVNGLVRKSDEIEAVVELISTIADQTNLLALNAAIESARAGEHGRGFAVVAEEVRKLAEKSQQSTKEIANLINSVRHDINDTVQAIENGGTAVNKTALLVGDAGSSLNEISETAAGAAAKMSDLVNAFNNVERGISAVQSAMQSIAAVSEETSASTEEVSASTEEQSATIEELSSSARGLADMAHELNILVARFRV